MISRIFRPIKEGFKGAVRHSAMSGSSIGVVTLTLLIISMFVVVSFTIQTFTESIEESVSISVLVNYENESAEEEDALSLAIQNIEGVSTVTYSSKDDEFQYYIDSFDDEDTKEAFEPFRDSNPMHDAFYVETESGSDIELIANTISELPSVYSVNYGGESATGLISGLRVIRTIGWGVAIIFIFFAVMLIRNTIKITIMSRADEIAIMRNVGAKNGFIRSPFLVEGLIIGAIGALIPIVVTYFGYQYLYEVTGGHIVSSMFVLLDPNPFAHYLCLFLLGVGMVVGFIGSYLSVTRYLRWKR